MTAVKRPPAKRQKAFPVGGRYRTRTDDLFRVKEARYQLRQSPQNRGSVDEHISHRKCCANRHGDTRGPRSVLHEG